MTPENAALLAERRLRFEQFYEELIPVLVDFVGRMGIQPAHEVLNEATAFAEPLGLAMENLEVVEADDRAWLLTRVGYFIGEYFAQAFGGHWQVCDLEESQFFARYVVGGLSEPVNPHGLLDPFEVARTFVDAPCPRNLLRLLDAVATDLVFTAQGP